MSQLGLFELEAPVLARTTDPSTSHAAAIDAQINAGHHRAKVAAMLRSWPDGLTDFELADKTGLGDNARKRRADLKNLGLVVDSGIRRASPSGSSAIVWTLATDDNTP